MNTIHVKVGSQDLFPAPQADAMKSFTKSFKIFDFQVFFESILDNDMMIQYILHQRCILQIAKKHPFSVAGWRDESSAGFA